MARREAVFDLLVCVRIEVDRVHGQAPENGVVEARLAAIRALDNRPPNWSRYSVHRGLWTLPQSLRVGEGLEVVGERERERKCGSRVGSRTDRREGEDVLVLLARVDVHLPVKTDEHKLVVELDVLRVSSDSLDGLH